jgi:predicted negative regulator of RcsB-dependent stress response
MATPRSSGSPSFESTTESMTDWAQVHSKQILAGVAAVALLVGGTAVWRSVQSGNAERAERQYVAAQQPLVTGDVAGAERELRKVLATSGDTPAGAQATLLLAKVLYEQGKYKEGVDLLRGFDGEQAEQRVAARSLMAAGHEEQRQFAEAAKAYEEASELASFRADKDNLKANAARAYGLAGNAAKAREIWTELAADEFGPVAGEARVRLGELAAPAARG